MVMGKPRHHAEVALTSPLKDDEKQHQPNKGASMTLIEAKAFFQNESDRGEAENLTPKRMVASISRCGATVLAWTTTKALLSDGACGKTNAKRLFVSWFVRDTHYPRHMHKIIHAGKVTTGRSP
jgi:hypothetical protein